MQAPAFSTLPKSVTPIYSTATRQVSPSQAAQTPTQTQETVEIEIRDILMQQAGSRGQAAFNPVSFNLDQAAASLLEKVGPGQSLRIHSNGLTIELKEISLDKLKEALKEALAQTTPEQLAEWAQSLPDYRSVLGPNFRASFQSLDEALDFAAKDKGAERIQAFTQADGQTVYAVADLAKGEQVQAIEAPGAGLGLVMDEGRGLKILKNTSAEDTGQKFNSDTERREQLFELARGAALNDFSGFSNTELGAGLKRGNLQKNLLGLMSELDSTAKAIQDELAELEQQAPDQKPDPQTAIKIASLKAQQEQLEVLQKLLSARMQILPDTRRRDPVSKQVIPGTGIVIPGIGPGDSPQKPTNIVGCFRSDGGKATAPLAAEKKRLQDLLNAPETSEIRKQQISQEIALIDKASRLYANLSSQAVQAQAHTDARKEALSEMNYSLNNAQGKIDDLQNRLGEIENERRAGAANLDELQQEVSGIQEQTLLIHGQLLEEMRSARQNFYEHAPKVNGKLKAGAQAALDLIDAQINKLEAVANGSVSEVLSALESVIPQWKESELLKTLETAGKNFDGITPDEVNHVGLLVNQTNSYAQAYQATRENSQNVQYDLKADQLGRKLEAMGQAASQLPVSASYEDAGKNLDELSQQSENMQALITEEHPDLVAASPEEAAEKVKALPEWQALEQLKALIALQQAAPSATNTPEIRQKLIEQLKQTLELIENPQIRNSLQLLAEGTFSACKTHEILKIAEKAALPEIQVNTSTTYHSKTETETAHQSKDAPDVASNPLFKADFQKVQAEVNQKTLGYMYQQYTDGLKKFTDFQEHPEEMIKDLLAYARFLQKNYPDSNNLEAMANRMEIYFEGDSIGNTGIRSYAETLLKNSRMDLDYVMNLSHVKNHIVPYLLDGVEERTQDFKNKLEKLDKIKNNFEDATQLTLELLQKYPDLRSSIYSQMNFKTSADAFPSKDNLPLKPTLEDFSGKKEILFLYNAANFAEPSFGDYVTGFLEDLPVIKTVVHANNAADLAIDHSAGVASEEQVIEERRTAIKSVATSALEIAVDIGTAGASKLLKLKGVAAELFESGISSAVDTLVNGGNYFENLGADLVMGKVFELGGKGIAKAIPVKLLDRFNKRISIDTPEGFKLTGKIEGIDPVSNKLYVKLDGSDKVIALDFEPTHKNRPSAEAVSAPDSPSAPERPAAEVIEMPELELSGKRNPEPADGSPDSSPGREHVDTPSKNSAAKEPELPANSAAPKANPEPAPQAGASGGGDLPPNIPPEPPEIGGPGDDSGKPRKTPQDKRSDFISLDGEDIPLEGYRASEAVLDNHKLKDYGEAARLRNEVFNLPEPQGFEKFKAELIERWNKAPDNAGIPFGLTDQQLREHFDTLKGLDDRELAAVIGYRNSDAQNMNRVMRGDPDALAEFADEITRIKTNIQASLHSLDKLPKYEGTSYRGFSVDKDKADAILDKYRRAEKDGTPVIEKQFQSSSARDAGNPHLKPDGNPEKVHIRMEFETDKGVDYRTINVDEDEIIMPPGEYTVASIEKEKVGDQWCYTIKLKDAPSHQKSPVN